MAETNYSGPVNSEAGLLSGPFTVATAPTDPTVGQLAYFSDLDGSATWAQWDGAAWSAVGGGGGGLANVYTWGNQYIDLPNPDQTTIPVGTTFTYSFNFTVEDFGSGQIWQTNVGYGSAFIGSVIVSYQSNNPNPVFQYIATENTGGFSIYTYDITYGTVTVTYAGFNAMIGLHMWTVSGNLYVFDLG